MLGEIFFKTLETKTFLDVELKKRDPFYLAVFLLSANFCHRIHKLVNRYAQSVTILPATLKLLQIDILKYQNILNLPYFYTGRSVQRLLKRVFGKN